MIGGALDLLTLNLFRDAVREGSVTAAALRQGIGQPHASRLLARLQRRLGLSLLIRSGRRLVPTEAGLLFLEEVDRTLSGIDRLAETARDIAANRRAPVRLLVQSHLAHGLMPGVLRRLAVSAPGLRIDLDIRQRNRLTGWAGRADPDVVLAAWPLELVFPRREILLETSYGLAIPAGHPLARQDHIAPADLAGEDLITVRPGLSTRDWLQEMMKGFARRPRIVCETGSVLSAVQLAAEGLGLALTDPFLASRFRREAGVVFRPIKDGPRLSYCLMLRAQQPWAAPLRAAILAEARDLLAAWPGGATFTPPLVSPPHPAPPSGIPGGATPAGPTGSPGSAPVDGRSRPAPRARNSRTAAPC
ncbi:LysR family transcriptional regulator [Roseomonas sp. HJA6]|uniref:LysR family transcriptional regulator n=1 Tax=Roseomonas alba TaxID=2846776 RepID=A0ABS7A4T0_9PROT|nr:LysR family transcriptional regulator [Neoroseomonas alba]